MMRKSCISIVALLCAIVGWHTCVFAQVLSFEYTGKIQTYTVPKQVSSISIDMQGATGGGTAVSRGGYGGRVQCQLAVTPGDVLYLYIGGTGPNSTSSGVGGGYNGGGAGSEDGAGGGGASDVRYGGTALSNRVIVAGGGGGACGATYVVAKDYDRGGDGGSLEGETGYRNGKNAGLKNNFSGVGGTSITPANDNFRNGTQGAGGNGYAYYIGGGGGGGGYYGGSGGDENGGGGGSSYTDPVRATSVIHTRGYNTSGSGKLVITPILTMIIPPGQESVSEKKKITEDSSFKHHGHIYGTVFCDYFYKAHADTTLGVRSALSQYAVVPANTSMFQFRRINLGYNYEISPRFSAEFLLAAEDDYNVVSTVSTGDLLANNKFAPYIKLANIRWKNIFKGSDLVFGQLYTPVFHYTSEEAWGYRSIQKTIADVYRTPEYDMGVSLQGHLPSNDNFGYNLMVGNGDCAKPENNPYKWFYGDVYYKFFHKRLIIDFYADYEKLIWVPDWHNDRQMNKVLVAYSVPKFTIGFEGFTNRLLNDDIATRLDGVTKDTIITRRKSLSLFTRGKLYKNMLGFFIRYDSYNIGGKDNNSVYKSYESQTAFYDQCTRQQFVTFGIDYSPYRNIHIMPNMWYEHYTNIAGANFGPDNDGYDLIYRLTISYQFNQ